MLVNAGVTAEELEKELTNYVDKLEQRLNEKVDIMRERLEREKRKQRILKANQMQNATSSLQKN